jgi:putative DNA primase/helicase
MLDLAEAQKGYVIEPTELDQDDHLLNVENGTLNLATGELQPPRRQDFITKRAPVSWNPTAKSATWDDFLATVLPNAEVRAFFQRAVGYSLTGDMQAHALFFVYGPTASGKSTAMGAIKTALGNYVSTSNTDVFLAKRFEGGNTPELAKLPGVRMILMSELPPNKAFNAPLVKQWTGGDEIQATAKYQAPFEFKPKGKLWFTGNDRPHVAFEDLAFWRRVYMILFEVSIPKEAQDPMLQAKLRQPEVQSAILAWAYEGLLAFQQQGLNPPPAVDAAVEDYQDEVDPLQDFIAECCLLDPDAVTSASELHLAYVKHANDTKDAGTKPVSKTRFGKLIHARGLTPTKVEGQRAWKGIGLKAPEGSGWSPPGGDASSIPF